MYIGGKYGRDADQEEQSKEKYANKAPNCVGDSKEELNQGVDFSAEKYQ